jgi:BirA family biotin operon repressor/biotin-[acetyl-CoA-carboxylase] ligase
MNFEPLDTESINRILHDNRFGKRIMYLPTTTSTNSEAKQLIEDGCEEGTVVVADVQTAGHGRLDRTWYSPPGGLWFSIVLKPEALEPQQLTLLSLMAGVAAAEVLNQQFQLDVQLKWPNDLLKSGKKLGGILTESVFSNTNLLGVVIGLGINLNQDKNELHEEIRSTAITLRSVLPDSNVISRENVLAGIISKLEKYYQMLNTGKVEELLTKWGTLSTTIGSRVKIELENGNYLMGLARGLDPNGALLIEADNGAVHTILAGDCIHLVREV